MVVEYAVMFRLSMRTAKDSGVFIAHEIAPGNLAHSLKEIENDEGSCYRSVDGWGSYGGGLGCRGAGVQWSTNVVLDTQTLATAASLNLSSVSSDVIVPGSLPGSVAFGINARDAAVLPTTFQYDSNDFLGTFSGTIEHAGSVFFNADTVEVGDFTIGFDAARAGSLGGNASGFFVQSNAGIAAILFDIQNPSELVASETQLRIGANLLVSPEFGSFLFTNGLSTADLAGADVGDALVEANVPAPGTMLVAGLVAVAGLRRRR